LKIAKAYCKHVKNKSLDISLSKSKTASITHSNSFNGESSSFRSIRMEDLDSEDHQLLRNLNLNNLDLNDSADGRTALKEIVAGIKKRKRLAKMKQLGIDPLDVSNWSDIEVSIDSKDMSEAKKLLSVLKKVDGNLSQILPNGEKLDLSDLEMDFSAVLNNFQTEEIPPKIRKYLAENLSKILNKDLLAELKSCNEETLDQVKGKILDQIKAAKKAQKISELGLDPNTSYSSSKLGVEITSEDLKLAENILKAAHRQFETKKDNSYMASKLL
jgi:hypothetical protein